MKISIEANPKEIADLVLSLQDRHQQPINKTALAASIRNILLEEARSDQNGSEHEKETLAKEIESFLGEGVFNRIGQDLALVIEKYDLTRRPDLCRKIFRYMSLVVQGWNLA